MPQPRTAFEWPVYADATFAGLSLLIPLPLVDWVFEEFFRRRMPAAIARYRGQSLAPAIVSELNRGEQGCLAGCLTLPIVLVYEFIKRFSTKVLYFLAVKGASDRISYYWHRAFLLDYMLLAGHLNDVETARRARQAMDQVLRQTSSPLNELARQVLEGTRHTLRTLLRARRGGEDEVIAEKRTQMSERWGRFEGYLRELAARYDATYQQLAPRAA